MRLFISLCLVGFFVACADLQQSDQLNRISRLQKKADSLIIVLNQVNDSKLTTDIEQNELLLNEITNLAALDTISEEEARLIDVFVKLSNQLSVLKEKMKFINRSLNEQINAILALENDIKNGFGKRDKYNQNLSFEENKLKKMERLLNDVKTKKVKTVIKTAILNTKIRNIQSILQLNHKQA
jgi:hypothetical protein